MGVEAFEADEPRVVPAPVEPETAPIIMASIVAAPGRRPELRLTPLIAALDPCVDYRLSLADA